jgi:hypothetical protein
MDCFIMVKELEIEEVKPEKDCQEKDEKKSPFKSEYFFYLF